MTYRELSTSTSSGMGQLPAIMLSDAAFCGMLRDSNREPRFEPCPSHQDPTIGSWLMRRSFLSAGSLRDQVRASRGIAADAHSAPSRSRSSNLALHCRLGTVFGADICTHPLYSATKQSRTARRIRGLDKKVLTQYIVGPSTPLDGCRGVWWPWLGGPGPRC